MAMPDKDPPNDTPTPSTGVVVQTNALEPPEVQEPPPIDEDASQSIEFMIADLAKSGIQILPAPWVYPIKPYYKDRVPYARYVILSGDGVMWQVKKELPPDNDTLGPKKEDKYYGPKDYLDVMLPPGMTVEDYTDIRELWIIEGWKKDVRFLQEWAWTKTVSITGCNCCFDRNGDIVPTLKKILCHAGIVVNVILDGDIYDSSKGVGRAASIILERFTALGFNVNLYAPPVEKGVDDWLEALKTAGAQARITDLQKVNLNAIERSRKNQLSIAGVKFGANGVLFVNPTNGTKIILHDYKDRLFKDKRLGLILDNKTIELDALIIRIREELQSEFPFFTSSHVPTAIEGALQRCQVDLVKTVIETTQWDGVKRLDEQGEKLFQTTVPAYASKWFRILILTVVKRTLDPGCKADHVSILAGPQGIGKSTFFEALSEIDGIQFYSNITTLEGTGSDANRTLGHILETALIVDLGEGVAFAYDARSIGVTKNFLSQRFDEFRVAYARAMRRVPRGFAIVGTTNFKDFIGDVSGSRRYNALWVEKINRLDYKTKLQLFAEAKVVLNDLNHEAMENEKEGEEWWRLTIPRHMIPASVLEGHEHIQNTQALMNTQHVHTSPERGWLQNYLLGDEFPTMKDFPDHGFINPTFLMHAYAAEHSISTGKAVLDLVTKALEMEQRDVHSPWLWNKVPRPSKGVLNFRGASQPYWFGDVTQLRGLTFTAKPSVASPPPPESGPVSGQ